MVVLFHNRSMLDRCSICLEGYGAPERNYVRTFCDHVFHPECLAEADGDTCPLCRTPLQCVNFGVEVTADGKLMEFVPFSQHYKINGGEYTPRTAARYIRDFIGTSDASFRMYSEPGSIFAVKSTEDSHDGLIEYFTLPVGTTARCVTRVARMADSFPAFLTKYNTIVPPMVFYYSAVCAFHL